MGCVGASRALLPSKASLFPMLGNKFFRAHITPVTHLLPDSMLASGGN